MTERKSEQMKPLKCLVKKITVAFIFILLLVSLGCRNEGMEIANQIIERSFAEKSKHNDTHADAKFSMSILETLGGGDLDQDKIEEGIQHMLGQDKGDLNPFGDDF
jgi:hypothetical protein